MKFRKYIIVMFQTERGKIETTQLRTGLTLRIISATLSGEFCVISLTVFCWNKKNFLKI